MNGTQARLLEKNFGSRPAKQIIPGISFSKGQLNWQKAYMLSTSLPRPRLSGLYPATVVREIH